MTSEQDLKYTSDHEWVDADGDVATVGITGYAADQLGDIVYAELPAVGDTVEAGQVVGELESTKSVGELFCPVSGEVVEVNEAVSSSPEIVNSDPTGAGWLLKVRFTELPDLLDKAAYDALTGAA
ncbi:glycine cleavage system protein GcvH [Amnibacterium kyonggiense]|uniref:Glycine cleavage system H protein n=1 Tax=Amnibacterium kyonggiense TaxID=595671 RepID=A0A4R7FJA3_9MICO|nr:glycine cleavage system protein GcvH [Amnibacterium kyonggiense]TDS76006.1 glycine cleavage system H protein [Amnibacterium kyonggiense]